MIPRPSRFSRRKPKPAENKATVPTVEAKAVEEVVEELAVTEAPAIRHIGGPWFEVDGVKYNGRAAAEAAYAEALA